jgi:hypothetical protein
MLCVVFQILVLKFFGAGFQQLAVSKWQLQQQNGLKISSAPDLAQKAKY